MEQVMDINKAKTEINWVIRLVESVQSCSDFKRILS